MVIEFIVTKIVHFSHVFYELKIIIIQKDKIMLKSFSFRFKTTIFVVLLFKKC